MLATVEDGKVVRLQGDPDHPVTRGFLCYRTSRFPELQNDPDRLTTPLLRRGDGFEPVGWDQALDQVAETLLRIREASGPAAILNYRSGGSLGLMKFLINQASIAVVYGILRVEPDGLIAIFKGSLGLTEIEIGLGSIAVGTVVLRVEPDALVEILNCSLGLAKV